MAMTCLKVTSAPSGEAPLWVREKWVGLSLPVAQAGEGGYLPRHRTFGVLSRPRGLLRSLVAMLMGRFGRTVGYRVQSRAAIDLLARSSPDAAGWWRANAPDLLKPRRYFVFDKGCGHLTTAGDP